jgi:hypothetical protein
MKAIKSISRIILGIVFIFSGTVKAIDPLGTAYKFHDYFHAFNMTFLDNFCLAFSLILCTAEFIGGFSVLTGIRQRAGIVLVTLLMLVFTPLTFILALTNPVSDCGCFGDAIQLTNWQTFWKNIVLLAAALVLFYGRKSIRHTGRNLPGWAGLATATMIFLLFALYNLKYLPVIDFLPYSKGTKIADKMVIPENARPDKYETTFIYEKDGVRKEFTLNDYPANDSSWKFIDQKSVLISKGTQPPIHDFSITDHTGTDITPGVLADQNFTLIMIAKKLDQAKASELKEGFSLGRYCMEKGIKFYILTASGSDDISKYNNGLIFCTADETTLKTMVRSNPGFMLIKNGIIEGKWSHAGLPDREWFGKHKQ